jgi:hypothetical protein
VCLLHANVELPPEEAVHLADKGKPPLMLEHGQDKHACFKVGVLQVLLLHQSLVLKCLNAWPGVSPSACAV